ncbi:MAG TPA: helix-turn-helix domain-containing protein [Candidatus Limnocylindrales bacterium]
MGVRERPGDLGAADARRILIETARDLRTARRALGISQAEAGKRAGLSQSQVSRLERGNVRHPKLEHVCRAIRAVGLVPSLQRYPGDVQVRDRAQLALLARFESLLAPPIRMRREIALPIPGDKRAWDGRLGDGTRTASIEGESRIDDCQALARRIELKTRDDPGAGPVILVVNRTNHNSAVLRAHRESLRAQFPLDGAAIARSLRRGEVPSASGIILL